jgi:hydroxymethylpyrimidine/phosphomethylpyrimidine kinase
MKAGSVKAPAPPGGVAIALSIAGSDPSGGAGIQADLKTFSALGVYGAAIITALTAQNTLGVQAIEEVPATFILTQIDSVLSDLEVSAAKTGMLGNRATVLVVAKRLRAANRLSLIVDPVMAATTGDVLLEPAAVAAVRDVLIAGAVLVTPNLPEAAQLLGVGEARNETEMEAQGRAIMALGAKAVLMKGGHGTGADAVDLLVGPMGIERFAMPRIDTPHTHGTGCALSAAITAMLAAGAELSHAVRVAKEYVWQGLQCGRDLGVGQGHGPIDHLHPIPRKLRREHRRNATRSK